MPEVKDRETIKQRLERITRKAAGEQVPELPPLPPPKQMDYEEPEEQDMGEKLLKLASDYEQKKAALLKGKKVELEEEPEQMQEQQSEPRQHQEPQQEMDLTVGDLIEMYQNNGRFRVDLLNQLAQINKSLSLLTQSLK